MGSGLEPMMQTATPPRIIRGDFPHLCPGDACAVCTWVSFHANRRLTADDIAQNPSFRTSLKIRGRIVLRGGRRGGKAESAALVELE